MTRYRLVAVQAGDVHVSSVLLAEDEVQWHLTAEKQLHEVGGWNVEVVREHGKFFPQLLCVKGVKVRRIYVRTSTAFDDSVTLDTQHTSPGGAAVSPEPARRGSAPSPSWLRETPDGFSIEDRL